MFPLVETIRVEEGKIQYPEYHRKRIYRSLKNLFGKAPAYSPLEGIGIPPEMRSGIVKLRFLYSPETFSLEFIPYKPLKVERLKAVTDNEIDYAFKYTDRSRIKRLYAMRDGCDDILIIRNDLITDTSIANLLFFDGTEWVTPSTPLLAGTCRERLLDEGKIRPAEIKPGDLRRYTHFKIINAIIQDRQKPVPIANIIF